MGRRRGWRWHLMGALSVLLLTLLGIGHASAAEKHTFEEWMQAIRPICAAFEVDLPEELARLDAMPMDRDRSVAHRELSETLDRDLARVMEQVTAEPGDEDAAIKEVHFQLRRYLGAHRDMAVALWDGDLDAFAAAEEAAAAELDAWSQDMIDHGAPECAALAGVTVPEGDLDAPEDAVDEPAAGTSDGASTEPAGSEGDGPPALLIALGLLGLVALVGGGVRSVRRRRPATTVPPACTTSCSVTIEGRDEFGMCCMRPTYRLRAASAEERMMVADPSRIHLDGDVAGQPGMDVVDAIYAAHMTATCSAGGTADPGTAAYEWSIEEHEDRLVLHCAVEADVSCPAGVEHPPVACEGTLEIAYHDAPCTVGVVISYPPLVEDSVTHVDIHIVCGEYSEVFGFFAQTPYTLLGTLGGHPGDVVRQRAGAAVVQQLNQGELTSSLKDQIGADYVKSNKDDDLTIYWIEPDDCGACVKLRMYWEALKADPPTYYLLGRNCATVAWDSLIAAGLLPDTAGSLGAYGTPREVDRQLGILSLIPDEGDWGPVTISRPTQIDR